MRRGSAVRQVGVKVDAVCVMGDKIGQRKITPGSMVNGESLNSNVQSQAYALPGERETGRDKVITVSLPSIFTGLSAIAHLHDALA